MLRQLKQTTLTAYCCVTTAQDKQVMKNIQNEIVVAENAW